MGFQFLQFLQGVSMEEHFPPNSAKSKDAPKAEKKVERVVTEGAKRRKKGLGRQFKETFIGGDSKTAARYMYFEVLVPSAKEAIAEAFREGIDRLIFGDSRGRKSVSRGAAGGLGHVQYNRMGPDPRERSRSMSQRGRARHDFDEIVLTSMAEGNEVIDTLVEAVSRYGEVSVADLYVMVGIASTHADHKWGWTDLREAGVSRVRGGFLLDLPDPEPLD